ncbi:hypothetical protein [Luteitalea sp.]
MRATALTPHITVAIGQQVRQYHAYITTAPAALDAPATMTLYRSTVTDLAGFASHPEALGSRRSTASARLVVVDVMELAWQRARCTEAGHQLTTPDEVLVSLSTLQLWLWQRLKAPLVPDPDLARAS